MSNNLKRLLELVKTSENKEVVFLAEQIENEYFYNVLDENIDDLIELCDNTDCEVIAEEANAGFIQLVSMIDKVLKNYFSYTAPIRQFWFKYFNESIKNGTTLQVLDYFKVRFNKYYKEEIKNNG